MRVVKAKFDPELHRDYMSTFDPDGLPVSPEDAPSEVYELHGRDATLCFLSLDQVKTCLDWFEEKTHPSTRENYVSNFEHFWQPWHSRLPKAFISKTQRPKVINTLRKLLNSEGITH